MQESDKVSATVEKQSPTISVGYYRTGSNGDAKVHVFADQSTGKRGFWDYIKVMRENELQKTFDGTEKAYVLDPATFELVRPDLEGAGFNVHEAKPEAVAARGAEVKKSGLKPIQKLTLLGLKSIVQIAEAGELDDAKWKRLAKHVAEMLA